MNKFLIVLIAAAGMALSPAAGSGGVMEKATFGAGCFWHVEEAFRHIKGVVSTRVGYMGGKTEEPTYRDVCSHTTGHAEVVEVTFDPSVVGYGKLLDVFWDEHDPTSWNKQGPDRGDQYRSVVFYHSDNQKMAAEESKRRLDASGEYDKPVVTLIEPAGTFWMAEEYHQQYLEKHGRTSCGIK